MTRSKIKEEKVAGQYQHLGDPSKKVVLRAGGVMHSSEDGKPRENEAGTWSVKTGEAHISVDGHNFIFEIKDNGNLQVVALLDKSVREDVSERIKKAFILKRIIADSGKPKATLSQMVQGRWLLCFIVLVLASLIYQSCWPVRETASKSVEIADPIVEIADPIVEIADPIVEIADPIVEIADPIVEIADPIVEKAIRVSLRKFAGELNMTELEKVTELRLNVTQITDEGLNEVIKLPKLRGLSLWDTKITDAGLKEVIKLKHLSYLNLGGTKITDAGLKELAKLKSLTELNLRYTQITDAGLKELAKCKQLEKLHLGHTQITDTDALRKALPKCKIGN